MTVPTHVIAYIFTVNVFGISFSLYGFLLGILGSLLPDIDNVHGGVGKVIKPVSSFIHQKWGHRTLFHSWAMVVVSLLVCIVIKFFTNNNHSYLLLMGVISHIVLDMINISGVKFFYPDKITVVMPSEQEYRVGTASKKEKRLCFVLLVLMILTLPFTIWGYETTFRFIAGSHTAAIEEYKKYVDTNEIFVEVTEGINRITQERVKDKRYKVIAAMPKKLTLVEDDKGKRITLGNTEDATIETRKMKVHKGVSIKTEVIDLTPYSWSQILKELEYPYSYVIGIVEVNEKIQYRGDIDQWDGISINDKILTLNYADYKSVNKLTKYSILSAKVKIRREISEEGIIGPLKEIDHTGKTIKFLINARYDTLTITEGQEVFEGQTLSIDPEMQKTKAEADSLKASLHTIDTEDERALSLKDKTIELKRNLEILERNIQAQIAIAEKATELFKEAETSRLEKLLKDKQLLIQDIKETERSTEDEKKYIKERKNAKKKEVIQLIKAKEEILKTMIRKSPITGTIVSIRQISPNSQEVEIRPKEIKKNEKKNA